MTCADGADVVIFVVGMARSGSSAITRVLSLCGGVLPGTLLPPNKWNPAGYWEPSAAVSLNAEFLRDCGSSFFDTQILDPLINHSPDGPRFIARIAELLQEFRHSQPASPLVLKDPRIGVLLPYWLAASSQIGLSPRIVAPIRHPNEVAVSLATWKGVSGTHAVELWLKYNLLTERYTRNLPRSFLSYSNLLSNWRREVLAIAQALELSLPLNREVESFLNPALRHEASEYDSDLPGVPWVREVFHTLNTACNGGRLDQGVLDRAFEALTHAQRTGERAIIKRFGLDFGLPA